MTTVGTVLTDQQLIAGFNRGPVISTFIPPASCLSTLTWSNSMYFGHRGSGYFDTACFPTSTLNLGPSAWDIYYYSPAQCPLGWYQATQFTSSFTGWDTATTLSLGPSTTAVLCCPSGYFYAISGLDHQCQSAFTSTSSTLLYINPNLNDNVWYSTDGNSASTTTATASPTYNVYGDGIPVWWQSSDLAAFAAATGQPTTRTNSPTSSSGTTTTSSTNSSTPPPSTNGLTSGAKIGIGIGIPLIIISLGILAFTWFTRSRHKNRVLHSELQGTVMDKYPQEVPAGEPTMQELYSDGDPYQYSRTRAHAELPGHG